MRMLSDQETRFIAGGDMAGDTMIRVGTQLVAEGRAIQSLPGGSITSAGFDRAGHQLIDAGNRRNDTTGGGPPGGGPKGG